MAPSKQDMANEAALQEAQQLLNLWLQTKNFLAKAFTDTPVNPAEEKQFLETKSAVSQYTRLVSQKLPPSVKIGGERMQDMMRQAISITHLRSLPKADKQVLVANWHAAFVNLARAVGALQFINEGYKVQAAVGPAGKKGGPVKKKASADWAGRIKMLIMIAIIAAVGYYLYQRFT